MHSQLDGECLVWIGGLNTRGYGYVAPGGGGQGSRLAHRVAWEHYTGSALAPGDVVHHTCSNKRCIRVEHLQLVSHQENSAEMLERQFYLRRIAELEAEVARLKE